MAILMNSSNADTSRELAVRSHFGSAAAHYSDLIERWPASWLRRREADAVIEEFGRIKGLNVLDLGCGAGFYTHRLLAAGAAGVTAVDSCPEMLAELPNHGLLRALLCDAAALPVMGPFDGIVSAGLLEFVERPESVLNEARRVVAKNGVLVLLVPIQNSGGRIYARWHERHSVTVRLFEPLELKNLAAVTGWRQEGSTQVWPFSLVLRLLPVS